jgi:hypothetical protein
MATRHFDLVVWPLRAALQEPRQEWEGFPNRPGTSDSNLGHASTTLKLRALENIGNLQGHTNPKRKRGQTD